MKHKNLLHFLACSLSIALGGAILPVTTAIAQTANVQPVAKQGKIKGRITNAEGEAASDLNVSLKGTSIGIITEEDGSFILKAAPGHYDLVISAVGLETKEMHVDIKAEETTDLGAIKINASSQQLAEAVVKSTRNKYKVSEPSNSLRLQGPLLNVAQNIQVVSGKLLQDQQAFDMLEGITRNVSGATRLEHWDNYAYINMRGSQIAAFRNGMNVAMPWGPLTEDMSFVENIEFVKGPAGFMMANGEPSGFYNIVTKKPTGIRKNEFQLATGSYGFYRGTLDLDGKLDKEGKLQYRLNLMGQTKDSWRPNEWGNRYLIAPVISYKISDQTTLTAEYTYQYSQSSVLGSNYSFSNKGYGDLPRDFTLATPNIAPNTIKDHSAFVTLNHKFNDNWKMTAQLAYLKFNQVGNSLWPSFTYGLDDNNNMVRTVSIWDAMGENKMGQVFVNGKVSTGKVNHYILAGLDMGSKKYIADWSQSYDLDAEGSLFNIYNPNNGPGNVQTFDRSKPLSQRGGLQDQSYTAIYVQDELHYWQDRIRLTLAGRYTNAKQNNGGITDDNRITPRVGLSVSVDKQTSVYAVYDQSFVPQVGKIFDASRVDSFRNATPLVATNKEIGIKRDWFGGRWNTTIAAYQITKNDALVGDPSHPLGGYSLQLGQTQTKGLEFDLRGEIIPGLNLMLNYAYTNSEITKDTNPANVGNLVPGFAKHLTNGWLSYRFRSGALKGLGFSLGYQYQVDRSTWSWGSQVQAKELPNYFRMDGGISWQNNKFNVALNVNNILDEYLYSGSSYGTYYYWQTEAPRNFRLSVGYKF